MPPIKIPKRVLAWRERLRRGSIMKPKTFRRIKGKAKRTGYRIPSAVGGKAYYVTLLSKYLDTHPGDVGVKILLSKLVRRRKMRNPISLACNKYPFYEQGKYWFYEQRPDGEYILLTTTPMTKDQVGRFKQSRFEKGIKTKVLKVVRGRKPKTILMGKKSKIRKNPSPKSTLIYDKLLGIEARKSHGKFKGENFRHDFKHDTDAVVMGNPDGSLTIRSKKGKRLWRRFNYE